MRPIQYTKWVVAYSRYGSRIIVFLLLCGILSCNPKATSSIDRSQIFPIQKMPKEYFVSDYNLFSIQANSFKGGDTIIEKVTPGTDFKSVITYARDEQNAPTHFKVRKSTTYDSDGAIVENGEYDIGRYINCCAGGACAQFYSYKIGPWMYNHPDSSWTAEVHYDIKKFFVRTSCEGGDSLLFGKINLLSSAFWDKNGKEIDPAAALIDELEKVTVRPSRWYTESYRISGDTINKVTHYKGQ